MSCLLDPRIYQSCVNETELTGDEKLVSRYPTHIEPFNRRNNLHIQTADGIDVIGHNNIRQ